MFLQFPFLTLMIWFSIAAGLLGLLSERNVGGAAEGLNGIYIIFVLSPFSRNPPFCQLRELG